MRPAASIPGMPGEPFAYASGLWRIKMSVGLTAAALTAIRLARSSGSHRVVGHGEDLRPTRFGNRHCSHTVSFLSGIPERHSTLASAGPSSKRA
jgi:hypothetical protein